MNQAIDFGDPPARRRRRREHAFYRLLAASAVAGMLPVVGLAWQVQSHEQALHRAGRLLQEEWHALRTPLAAADQAERETAALQVQLQQHAALATQRHQATALLDALGAAGTPSLQLQHLGWQPPQAELRGLASDQDAVQAFIDRLRDAGIGRVGLQELRARNAAFPQQGYAFVLSLQATP